MTLVATGLKVSNRGNLKYLANLNEKQNSSCQTNDYDFDKRGTCNANT